MKGKDDWIDCYNVWNEWMNWLLQFTEGTDELITKIYRMKRINESIDCCNVWNELMNLILQCMEWIDYCNVWNERNVGIKGCSHEWMNWLLMLAWMDELIAAMFGMKG